MAGKKGKAPTARVALTGRFTPGERVRLIKVDGPHVMRPPDGAVPVAEGRVDDAGHVEFTEGVELGARYFIAGYHRGQPMNVRVTGRALNDTNGLLESAPNQGV
jgi:hypothetical protein